MNAGADSSPAKRRRPRALASVVLALVLGTAISSIQALTLVRHGGGEYNSIKYSNSVEAINNSVALGAKLIEIDLIQSREGGWVCLHDYPEVWAANESRARWDHALQLWFAHMPRWTFPGDWVYPVSSELQARIAKNNAATRLHHCTMQDLVETSRQHPGVSFVSDTKYDNYKLLNAIARLPAGVFVPQVYNLREYKYARSLGFKRVIFTLYKHGDYSQLADLLNDPVLWKVVMPAEWLCAGSRNPPPLWLNKFPGEILVHTINDPAALCKSAVRIDGYYSDSLH